MQMVDRLLLRDELDALETDLTRAHERRDARATAMLEAEIARLRLKLQQKRQVANLESARCLL